METSNDNTVIISTHEDSQAMNISHICEKIPDIDLSVLVKPSKKNKGERGQQIERLLGLTNNSHLTDLKDGEIKSFTIGQSIAITQLKHCLKEILLTEPLFISSKVGIKIANTIYFAFNKSGNFKSWKYISSHHNLLEEITQDYQFISNEIKQCFLSNKKLHTITGPNQILQIRTKANKNKNGTYTPLTFNDITLNDQGMAFYFTGKFSKTISYE